MLGRGWNCFYLPQSLWYDVHKVLISLHCPGQEIFHRVHEGGCESGNEWQAIYKHTRLYLRQYMASLTEAAIVRHQRKATCPIGSRGRESQVLRAPTLRTLLRKRPGILRVSQDTCRRSSWEAYYIRRIQNTWKASGNSSIRMALPAKVWIHSSQLSFPQWVSCSTACCKSFKMLYIFCRVAMHASI